MRYSYAAELEKEEHHFADEDEMVESLRSGFWEAAKRDSEEPRDDEWDVAPTDARASSRVLSPVAAAR